MTTTTAGHPVIDDLIEWTTPGFDPVGPIDHDRLAQITASMDEHGWVGAPIVVDGTHCVTGSHRVRAAQSLWLDEIPVIQVSELAEAVGADWQDLLDRQPTDGSRWLGAARDLEDLLPRDVRDHLGWDIH